MAVTGDLANRIGAPLTLVHAINMPRTLARDAKASRWLTASRKRRLRATAASLRKDGLKVVESVQAGRADEALFQSAADHKAQLIVVPWKRRSVLHRMVARTRTPLLILREAEPFRAWLRDQRPLKVFVAYNFSTSSEAALHWVKQLTRAGPCEVVLGYVNQPIEDYLRIGARGPLPFGENPTDVLTVLARDMKARARAVLGSVPVRCRVEPDAARTDSRLAELAREEGADLIVTGSRQYAGLRRLRHGSVSRGLLRAGAMSIAIIPVSAATLRPPVQIPPPRHILVATDFSTVGNAAIPHALSLLSNGGIHRHARQIDSAS